VVVNMSKSSSIIYFEREGKDNLAHVLRIVKRALKRRLELRNAKLVIFTAEGEGPALAFSQLQQFEPQIIAVTFPPDFFVKKGEDKYFPRIHPKVRKLFDGVGVRILTGRLPFDEIEGAVAHNKEMDLIRKVLSTFGGSMPLAIQAVLQACDSGTVQTGEKVISITGDCALIVTASTTKEFLSKHAGLVVNEILCKPQNMSITKANVPAPSATSRDLFDESTPLLEKSKTRALSPPTQDVGKKP
jgi:hypothetical protein